MLKGTIDPIDDQDIDAILDDAFSTEAISAAIAAAARQALAEGEKINSDALGFVPAHTTMVDGFSGANEDSVRPDGEIEYTFNLMSDILSWMVDMLRQFAPVFRGRFKDSFELYADGLIIDALGIIPQAAEFVFISTAAYASKIEGENKAPESKQAPNGVFEAVATIAQHLFPEVNISFGYRLPFDASSQHRTPAITITVGS